MASPAKRIDQEPLSPAQAAPEHGHLVQEGVAQIGIESDQIVVLIDTADVENLQPGAANRGKLMVYRHQWPTLPQPCRHPGNRTPPDPEPASQPRPGD